MQNQAAQEEYARFTPVTPVHFELTDTFGGEATYAWVRRATQFMPDTATGFTLARRAKKWAGWTGVRCERADHGMMLELRPRGMCQVLFVTFD